ncbi:hypothetical protein OG819_14245 [Streptomyces sp. NBC_01549]|uniref:hypothetical protein n=1 Tax=Streptomyces sp. NBC_01549 TaxID=2975874 RepID=UPI00224FF63B|nr:hypothetical protein [Streptomyces sp. NBC_01549]MCX4590875.1 hypothetical protein [Streptomyces sp. NBC_01549]
MLRLRIQLTDWPRRALILTDTPRPDCPRCEGAGGVAYDYGDHNGEYAGTEWDPCTCWNETHRWVLMPLPRRPRWLRRRYDGRDPWGPGSYSDEPPF